MDTYTRLEGNTTRYPAGTAGRPQRDRVIQIRRAA